MFVLAAITEASATQIWLGGVDNQWTNPSNWSGGALPTSADSVIFNTNSANPSNWLAQPFSIAGIIFSNPLPITLSGSPLTIGPGGISGSNSIAKDSSFTNNSALIVNGPQVWRPGAVSLVMNGPLSGSGDITIAGGTTILNSSNACLGTITITPNIGGRIICKAPSALGTSGASVGNLGQIFFRSGSDTAPITTPFSIAGNGGTQGALRVEEAIGVTLNGDIVCVQAHVNAASNAFYNINGNIYATNQDLQFSLEGTVTNTIAGAISLGTGRFWKRASLTNSTLVLLSPSNSWTGGTRIESGTLRIGNGALNGSLPGDALINIGAVLAFQTASNTVQTYAGSLSGGSLVKEGLGALHLTGSNSITGGITNNEGALWFNANTQFGSQPISVGPDSKGTGIHLNGTNRNIVLSFAPFYISNSGIYNEAGDNVVPASIGLIASGESRLAANSGTLTLTGSISCQASNVDMKFAGAAQGTNNASMPFNSPGFHIIKQGSGVWTFNNTNLSFIGSNAVLEGTLVINGRLWANTNLNVFTGGTLAGYGLIRGPTTIMSGGTLALGANIGTLSISNDLTLNGTNIMMVGKSGGVTTNDLIRGITNLALGGTLILLANGSNWAAGDTFKLYDAKTINGTFASTNFPSLPSGLVWDLSGLTTGGDGTVRIANPPRPVFGPILRRSDGSVQLTFSYSGASGVAYSIWASSDLLLNGVPATWTLLTNGTFFGNPASYTDLAAVNYPRRFYLISIP